MNARGGRHGLALVAAAFAALTLWTWRRWPDALVDFGRDAYAAWRLSEGDALYVDLAWFNGPLSAAWNALWFLMAGPSLQTLFAVNLALAGLATVLVYRLVLRLCDAPTAAAAGIALLVLCAFGQFDAISAYNFVAPYSHEATHGIVACLAGLAALARWVDTPRASWLVLAGTCAGLALLTKTEMALAGVLGPLVALAFVPRATHGAPYRAMVCFLAAAGMPVLLAFLALAWQSGPAVALAGIAAPWRGAVSPAAGLAFYRDVTGLDAPFARLAMLAAMTLAWIAAVAVPAGVALAVGRSPRGARITGAPLFVLLTLYPLVLLPLAYWVGWPNLGRPLPLVAVAGIVLAWSLRARDPARAVVLLALGLEALILVAKMLLNARLDHYGFVLGLPALVLAVMLLVHGLPAWIGARGGRTDLARAGSLALLVTLCAAHVGLQAHRLAQETVVFGQGADAFFTDARRGPPLQQALHDLAELPADATLAVLPEGAMVNFQARRRNPTPYVTFMPPELLLFGEAAMLEALRAHPPDRIALVHKDTTEYGVPLFGRDYGQALMRWVRQNYRAERTYGDPPLEPGTTFGVALLARIPSTPSSGPR